MKYNMIRMFSVALLLVFIAPLTSIADSKASDRQERVSDTWIEAKLFTTYALNRNLSVFDIDVDVKDQVATLDGVVDSPIKKDLAGEIAKSIDGVKKVNNGIKVDSSKVTAKVSDQKNSSDRSFAQIIDDLTTTASIKTKLLADSNVSGMNINIDTMNNRVTLRGTVNSSAESELAAKVAENTYGVAEVTNKLEIKKERS